MALPATALPYGLRDVRLTPYDAAGVAGTPVDLPVSQTFSFEETEEFQELRGDDRLVAVRGSGPVVNWSLTAGGITLAAYKVLTGGTLTSSGATPAEKNVFSKKGADSRPYFKVEGQAISDSGGDVHCVLTRCKVTGNLSGEFTDGEFFISECDGQALPDPTTDVVYEFTQNETAVAIAGGS